MNSESASKGFKTFILTLAISLIVFSGIYYLVTNYASEKSFIAASDTEVSYKKTTDDSQKSELDTPKVAEVQGVTDTQPNPFKELAEKDDLGVAPQEVLAGADVTETTQSTTAVPQTGAFGITLGLVFSFILFGIGLFVVYLNPRNLAISSFEKKVTRQ